MTQVLGGWVPFHRKNVWNLLEEYPARFRAHLGMFWLALLLKANQAGSVTHEGQHLERGQLLFALRPFSEQTGIPIQTIRSILKWSESLSKLTRQTTHTGTILTIVHFDSYAPPAGGSNTESNQQVTHHQHTANTTQQENKRTREQNSGTPWPRKETAEERIARRQRERAERETA